MNKKFIFVIIAPIMLFSIATMGFHYIEQLSFVDSLYLTGSTITTVGMAISTLNLTEAKYLASL